MLEVHLRRVRRVRFGNLTLKIVATLVVDHVWKRDVPLWINAAAKFELTQLCRFTRVVFQVFWLLLGTK